MLVKLFFRDFLRFNFLLIFCVLILQKIEASPYPDPKVIGQREPELQNRSLKILSLSDFKGLPVIRVLVKWDQKNENYKISRVLRENSGTQALVSKAHKIPRYGSFKASLASKGQNVSIFYDSIGTGANFRKLVQGISFRFPDSGEKTFDFNMSVENPISGVMEKVLENTISDAEIEKTPIPSVKVRELQVSHHPNPLQVTIYAEGYLDKEEELFFKNAQKVPAAFKENKYPEFERFQIVAVFAPSKLRLGSPRKLDLPVKKRDSFLSLYYPYWWDVGRWYHIVYPTDEDHYRNSLAAWSYDYPIALVKSSDYWGVGNFKQLTAIPSDNSSFSYLLMHEFGHFMGLNEEYSEGGPTELEFAPQINEPWSQNITFLNIPSQLKWKQFVGAQTPVPTPNSFWNSRNPQYGAYRGGYAESVGSEKSHIPGLGCVMSSAVNFCPVCENALKEMHEMDSP